MIDKKLEEAAHHLLWVWYQYGDSTRKDYLEHRNMAAGEQAAEFLEELGYGEDEGYGFKVNQKGLDLMEKEF